MSDSTTAARGSSTQAEGERRKSTAGAGAEWHGGGESGGGEDPEEGLEGDVYPQIELGVNRAIQVAVVGMEVAAALGRVEKPSRLTRCRLRPRGLAYRFPLPFRPQAVPRRPATRRPRLARPADGDNGRHSPRSGLNSAGTPASLSRQGLFAGAERLCKGKPEGRRGRGECWPGDRRRGYRQERCRQE